MRAAEEVVLPHLEAEAADRLNLDQQRIRKLIERFALVSDVAMVPRPRPPAVRRIRLVLDELDASLKVLQSDQEIGLARLQAALPAQQLAHLADSFVSVRQEARKHIVLVTETAVGPTEAHVLRRRPDLGRAYAASLDALERRAKRR